MDLKGLVEQLEDQEKMSHVLTERAQSRTNVEAAHRDLVEALNTYCESNEGLVRIGNVAMQQLTRKLLGFTQEIMGLLETAEAFPESIHLTFIEYVKETLAFTIESHKATVDYKKELHASRKGK